jgi:O-acetylserine/cysteine efflux transporter
MGVPAIGVLAGVLVLGEQVSPLQWVGTGLVVAALMVVFVTRSR